jgi:AraC-like DNA-binding protein
LAITGSLPLGRHLAFETGDPEEARDNVARVFCPHRLDLVRPKSGFRARQHIARLGNLALSYIAYGAEVRIDPGLLNSFFLIHLVHSGRSEIHTGGSVMVGSSGMGSVSSPTLGLRMHWSADCAHLVLKVDRTRLERHLSDLLGEAVGRPIEFAPELPMESGAGAGFRRLVDFVSAELDCDDSLIASPLGVAHIEQSLMTALLTAQPNNYSAALAEPPSAAAPRHVVRAEAYIRAHADTPITIGALAEAAGVSARTLFEGFRRFRGTTPMAQVKAVRLERAYQELQMSPDQNVTDVAVKWGFVHLGRFARIYRRRFGELPSETLRRLR